MSSEPPQLQHQLSLWSAQLWNFMIAAGIYHMNRQTFFVCFCAFALLCHWSNLKIKKKRCSLSVSWHRFNVFCLFPIVWSLSASDSVYSPHSLRWHRLWGKLPLHASSPGRLRMNHELSDLSPAFARMMEIIAFSANMAWALCEWIHISSYPSVLQSCLKYLVPAASP